MSGLRRSSLPESSSSHTRTTYRIGRESRSFLSLDLAESRLSQRYGSTSTTTHPALPPLNLPVVSPLSSHFSLPPMPPTLPELPTLPAIQFPPDPTTERDRSSVLTKPQHLRSKKPKNLGIITTTTDPDNRASLSTVSTRVRRKNRWDALDTLEGKRKRPTPLPPLPPLPTLPHPPVKPPLNIQTAFIKPTTFAPRVPNFMSMSDDDEDDDFDDSATTATTATTPSTIDTSLSGHFPHLSLQFDDFSSLLLHPEDLFFQSSSFMTTRPISPGFNSHSYLDVDHSPSPTDEDEPVVMRATKAPIPYTPAIFTPLSSTPSGSSSPLKPKHHHSKKHRPHRRPTNNHSSRNNPDHYKSFIELDLDDVIDDRPPSLPATVSPTSVVSSPKRPERGKNDDLFEWRGRMGRGIVEGGGEWVWVD